MTKKEKEIVFEEKVWLELAFDGKIKELSGVSKKKNLKAQFDKLKEALE